MIARQSKDRSDYTDPTVKNGTRYTYTIRAVAKGADGSTYYSAYDREGKKTYYLRVGKIIKAKAINNKKVYVKWKKNKKASGYQLRYTKGSARYTKTIKNSSASSRTISKLKKGKYSNFEIRSYIKTNISTYYSAWSPVKKVKVK